MRHALALCGIVAAAACSGGGFDQPSASDFRGSSCHSVAPATLALGRDLHDIRAATPSARQRAALAKHQSALRAQQPRLDPGLSPAVQGLVTSVGILRLRADTDSYAPSLAVEAMRTYQQLVTTCTSR